WSPICSRPRRCSSCWASSELTRVTDSEAPLVLDVERLTFGFDALAHHGRQVVFVPYAAPEDRVQAEVVERRGGYLRARVAEVLVPGPDRVLPGCRYFPTCGGCQWQHVAPPAQRDAKAAIVAEQLARVAGVRDAEVLPTVPSPADWHYRARITLAVEGRRVGYRRARSHDLLEITDCPLAEPFVSAHLAAARAWVAALRVPLRRVTVSAAAGGVVLAASATARPGPADLDASEALLARAAGVRGTVVTGARERGAASPRGRDLPRRRRGARARWPTARPARRGRPRPAAHRGGRRRARARRAPAAAHRLRVLRPGHAGARRARTPRRRLSSWPRAADRRVSADISRRMCSNFTLDLTVAAPLSSAAVRQLERCRTLEVRC